LANPNFLFACNWQVDKSLDAAEKGDSLATSVAAALKSRVGASVASHAIGKGPVPFHKSTIRKPQELFAVAVDNSNSPFQAKGPYLSYDGEEDNAVGFNAEDWGAINSRADGGGAVRDTPDNGPAAGEAGAERDGGENAPKLVRDDGPVKRPKLSVEIDLPGRSSRPASPSSLAWGASPRPASPSRGILALDMHAKRLGSAKRGRVHPLERTLRELSYPAWQFQPPPDPLLEPEPIDARQIEIVDTLPGLRVVTQKLAVEREIACDLEAHHYRSFQGFVCLMQLSTRKEDFVVDTIALRDYVGPMLGPIFADSSILKVRSWDILNDLGKPDKRWTISSFASSNFHNGASGVNLCFKTQSGGGSHCDKSGFVYIGTLKVVASIERLRSLQS
jgi:hypothetical protein